MIQAERILVIKWGALGDLIAGTVALRALRESYPEATITILTNSLMKEVCPPGSLVDEMVQYEHERFSLPEHLRLLKKLRKGNFDVAINLRWTSERSAVLTRLSGARYRVGSGPKESRWMYNIKTPLNTGRRHEFLRHLDTVSALGIQYAEPRAYVHCSEPNTFFADNFIKQYRASQSSTLVIHPGASTTSKAWMPERFGEIGRRFSQHFHGKVIVTWGPGEEQFAHRVVEDIGSNAILSPPTTIGNLAALISRCGMCLCNYSGVMNVSMAVKTPLLALGCTSPEDWGPYGDLHRTVNSAREYDSYTDAERVAAMKGISVEQVWETLLRRWLELYPEAEHIEARS